MDDGFTTALCISAGNPIEGVDNANIPFASDGTQSREIPDHVGVQLVLESTLLPEVLQEESLEPCTPSVTVWPMIPPSVAEEIWAMCHFRIGLFSAPSVACGTGAILVFQREALRQCFVCHLTAVGC